jgi:hypothetical protein
MTTEDEEMPTHHAPLGTDQAKYRNQLAQAVEAINEVDDLLKTNTSSDLASNRATALALSAIGGWPTLPLIFLSS